MSAVMQATLKSRLDPTKEIRVTRADDKIRFALSGLGGQGLWIELDRAAAGDLGHLLVSMARKELQNDLPDP